MSHKTIIKIYEIVSYVLILLATAVVLIPALREKLSGMNIAFIAMLLIALATAARWGMERHRFKSAEDEIDQLQADLRRLTLLLAKEKKNNTNQSK